MFCSEPSPHKAGSRIEVQNLGVFGVVEAGEYVFDGVHAVPDGDLEAGGGDLLASILTCPTGDVLPKGQPAD